MDEAVRLWSYVLAKDVGIAPCVDEGILTLCTCKPKIRKGARVGDWVLARMPVRFGRTRVAWVGRVAEVIEMGEYAARYPLRPDALYYRAADAKLTHRGGLYHASKKDRDDDRSGLNCLRCEPFWYFGGSGHQIPDLLEFLCNVQRGHRKFSLDQSGFDELRKWLAAWPPGVHGEPREAAEGARWRAGMPWLRGADPGSSNLRGGGGPDGSGGPSCGQGSGRGVRGRAVRPRSC